MLIKKEVEFLKEKEIEKYKEITPNWGTIGYVVYKRCVTIDTQIFTKDLRWIPAGEIQVGTEILAFDEYGDPKSVGYKARKLKTAIITHNTIEESDCVEITLSDGSKLKCTPDHSWLVKKSSNKLVWIEAQNLLQKNEEEYFFLKFFETWEEDKSFEGGFLSAVFDMKGYLDVSAGILLYLFDNSIFKKVQECLNKFGFKYRTSVKDKKSKNYKKSYHIRITENDHVLRFLGMFRPARLLEKYLSKEYDMKFNSQKYKQKSVSIVSVKPIGKQKIAVISTSSKTHFTGGFPSHNTYSRRVENENRTEEWWETILRCCNGLQEIGADYTKGELLELYDHMFNMRGLVSGRCLWQLGTDLVRNKGYMDSLTNCWAVALDRAKSFQFAFEELMLGGGVTASIMPEHVNKLKPLNLFNCIRLDKNDADFIVPDSREGWISLLRRVLKSAFETGRSFNYSLHCIRSAGTPIKGFGGTASGPNILEEMIDKIIEVCKNRFNYSDKKLRCIDCGDIFNIIGSCVVAGNVRRTAELLLGDVKDTDFLKAKRWDLGNYPSWRSMSNNTICTSEIPNDDNIFWDGYYGKGEPYGLFNLDLARSHGRIIDKKNKYPDHEIIAPNPCAEIGLASFEGCNLFELFLPNIKNLYQAKSVARLLFKGSKAISKGNYLYDETNEIVHRNLRIGCSLTGIFQDHNFDSHDFDELYNYLREYDKILSKEWNVNTSVKITTIQPSGTKSLLPGTTQGIHPFYSKYCIRRIRMSASDMLVDVCKRHGYFVEPAMNQDGSFDTRTMIVSFPIKAPKGAKTYKEINAIQHLEKVKEFQYIWSDNSISATIEYKDEELDDIKRWLRENYKDNIKSISFLKHFDHGFIQAPLEEITEEKYNELQSKIKPITNINFDTSVKEVDDFGCINGICPIR